MTCYGVHIIFYCLKNKQRWFSRLYTSIMATEIGILLGIMISAMQKVNLQWQMINLTLTCKEKCTFFVLMSMPVSNWWQDIWHYFIIARGSYVLLLKKGAYLRHLLNNLKKNLSLFYLIFCIISSNLMMFETFISKNKMILISYLKLA